MTTVNEIYTLIDRKAPFSSQMSFDNAGLLIGDKEQRVSRVLISLDITEAVADEAAEKGCELIVSHHPIIFHPLKSVRSDDPTGRTVMKLIRSGISAVCCHTNLDVAEGGVNDCLAEAMGLSGLRLLAKEGVYADGTAYGCGRVGELPQSCSMEEFLRQTADALKPNGIRYVDVGRPVYRVAVGGGACADYMDDAIALGCDTFITSDVKYNGFLDAKDKGINLLDAGHFPTENVVCPRLQKWLVEAFPDTEFLLTEVHREVFKYFSCGQAK